MIEITTRKYTMCEMTMIKKSVDLPQNILKLLVVTKKVKVNFNQNTLKLCKIKKILTDKKFKISCPLRIKEQMT